MERCIQGIEGHIRAIFLALRERLSGNLESRDRIVMFIPEYAAYLLNCLEVGLDGKTAYERTKGKKPTVLGIEFGEKVLYKVKPSQKMEKINSRWEYGIFVGVRKRSCEIWIATQEKVFSVRTINRIPV